MNSVIVGFIGVVILLILIFARMPVGFAMALVGYAGFSCLVSAKGAGNILFADIYGTFNSYDYSVIPLFILMGMIISYSGTSRRIYRAAYKWLGHLPGGLAMTTIAAAAGFAAVCGSATAAVATIGTVSMPEMKKYKYDPLLSTGSVIAGGCLGPLIPPSVVLIIYGILTEQSIVELFCAGIIPGLLLAILFIICIYLLVIRNKGLAPPAPSVSFKERIKSLPEALDVFFLFCIIVGGLFMGWFTATEAAAVGAIVAFVIGLIRRGLNMKNIDKCIIESVKMTGTLLFILAGAFIFSRFLSVSKIPLIIADWVVGLNAPPLAIMCIIMAIFLLGGCFIEVMALMVLTLPIFYPVIVNLGYSPLLYGIILVILMGMGSITPPVGISVYIMTGIAKDVPIEVIFKGSLPFLLAMFACVVALLAFPEIALFLPRLLY